MHRTHGARTLVVLATLLAACAGRASAQADDLSQEIGIQAYIYAYPMVLMEITRRVSTNVEEPVGPYAPMNRFAHLRAFPDHTFREVVRPNADTLYSILWFDVTDEPVVVTVPDTGGRYYMLPMLDMWTDVFAAPGSRTTGTKKAHFAILGPGWEGSLPDDVEPIRAPTGMGWMIGRTQTNGPADYEFVHRIQDGFRVVPLSRWGRVHTPTIGWVDRSWDTKTPPPMQIAAMSTAEFFELFAELLAENPPHEMDWNMVAQLERIGLVPGEPFEFAALPRDVQYGLERAVPVARRMIEEHGERGGQEINGWRIARELMGSYGTSYLQRAHVAHIGLGANVPEDAVYPMTTVDAAGQPYHGRHRYVLHLDGEIPVRGFWSLTMYDQDGYFVENPIGRYAIGDRDELAFNRDGSVDLYIQHESPGRGKESNWLPAPKGEFNMVLRLYWPELDIITGTWDPPGVRRVD